MAEFPAFPLWTDAYLADTGELSTLEHGAYLLLLIAMWRAGGVLPNDDKKLARIARLGPRQWEAVKPVLWDYFGADGEQITQGRLADELQKARTRSTKAADSARAKYRKNKGMGSANAGSEHSLADASTSTTITITKSTRADARVDDAPRMSMAEFKELVWGVYPQNPGSSKTKAWAAFKTLTRSEQVLCSRAAPRVAIDFEEVVTKESMADRLTYHTHLSTWIADRGWEAVLT